MKYLLYTSTVRGSSSNLKMNSSWKLCSLLIIFLTTCIHDGSSITCFECRSDIDPDCGDPFVNVTIALTDCNLAPDLANYPDVRPTMCRKTRQRVDGKWRVFRGCGYLGEVGVGGNEKICLSNKRYDSIISESCTCNSRDGCNTGPMVYSDQLAVLLSAFLAYSIARFCNR